VSDSDENFADAPQTLGEIRSDRDGSAASWSPRDVLIRLLRDIDSGKLPLMDALIVSYREKLPDGRVNAYYSVASPDIHVSLGVLDRTRFVMQQRAFGDDV
jgi:hypothetical protein